MKEIIIRNDISHYERKNIRLACIQINNLII